MKKTLILFSPLENVLVDPRTFQWEDAREILDWAYLNRIPWVVWSRWPLQEVIYFRGQLGLTDPFIAESAGALYIPFGYFDVGIDAIEKEGHEVIENGLNADYLREFFEEFRRTNHLPIRFADEFSLQEFSEVAGIPSYLAGFYQNARYLLAFYMNPYEAGKWVKKLKTRALRKNILVRKKGSIYIATGRNDPRTLVAKLENLFKKNLLASPKIMAIGADPLDQPFLEDADRVFLFKNRGVLAENLVPQNGVPTVIDSVNPERWKAIVRLLEAEYEDGKDGS